MVMIMGNGHGHGDDGDNDHNDDDGDNDNDIDDDEDDGDGLGWWCITLGIDCYASMDIQELERTHHIMMIIATMIRMQILFNLCPDDTFETYGSETVDSMRDFGLQHFLPFSIDVNTLSLSYSLILLSLSFEKY